MHGFVLRDDVFMLRGEGQGERSLMDIQREVLAIPGNLSLSRLLERLVRERHHIALLVDEYGGTLGLVTLEDVIETLVGAEIMDEMDSVDDMRALARKRWEERAAASMGESGED